MEILSVVLAVTLVGVLSYLTCCTVFLALTGRPLSLALKFAWKLPAISLIGVPLFGVGGVVLPTVVMVTELSKRPGYSQLRDVFWTIMICCICSTLLTYGGFIIAWQIFD